MRRSRSHWCTLLAALTALHVITSLSRGFTHGPSSTKKVITRSVGSVARRAQSQFSLMGAEEAAAVASALSGKKVSGTKIEAKQDGAAVVLSGFDGDIFGNADVTAEMRGSAKGTPITFNARKTYPDTPLVVAFIDANKVAGMLLVG
eukprot:CAMPEP_0180781218 /NCGR_PEP_ID=MMETSP1038_2-20121128/47515_1 /TAXON_ID=632150 /ORGANISM="Azadinium spinosum, Strain 3D9" /LENGTH=146 /DNA_ID=CAMNT_0022816989 /DNA_START=29 /DNA_END=466 /DNA_ORIENTATION=+